MADSTDLYLAQKAAKQTVWESDSEILSDLLILVGVDVPVAIVTRWTKKQREEAEKWAAKTHLKASDNNVRVPPKPLFL